MQKAANSRDYILTYCLTINSCNLAAVSDTICPHYVLPTQCWFTNSDPSRICRP